MGYLAKGVLRRRAESGYCVQVRGLRAGLSRARVGEVRPIPGAGKGSQGSGFQRAHKSRASAVTRSIVA